MNRYRVTLKEPAFYCLEIEAESPEDAEDSAFQIWNSSPPTACDYGDLSVVEVRLLSAPVKSAKSPRRRRRFN